MAKRISGVTKKSIIAELRRLDRRVFKQKDFATLVSEFGDAWGIPPSVTVDRLLELLVRDTELRRAQLKFPNRSERRFLLREASVYDLALSLRNGAYLTHYTAMYVHGITEQIPKTVYVNYEQSPKPRSSSTLSQASIDTAFKRRVRVSRNEAQYEQHKLILLSGMHTGRLGVTQVPWGSNGVPLDVTGIERTLIDIAVRPVYAGGVFEVLRAYQLAASRVSVNRLAALLRKLDYVYPYHQAVGFYLDKAGVYGSEQLAMLREIPMEFDFHLVHEMAPDDTEYSEKWRLFYPKGF
jgi:predicted transcriptional regulator of viral defense system